MAEKNEKSASAAQARLFLVDMSSAKSKSHILQCDELN
jgi:hypothetical protein